MRYYTIRALTAGLLIAAFASVGMAGLPYNPTRILSSLQADGGNTGDDGDHIFYVFQPSATAMAASSFDSRLSVLNTSRAFDARHIPSTTISDPLPFAAHGNGYSYTPATEPQGGMVVWAGKCQDGASGARLWRFTRSNETEIGGGGDWTALKTTIDQATGNGSTNGSSQGANFLASGISFASTLNARSNLYVFGGMCPDTEPSATVTWTQSGEYSNTMLTLRASEKPAEDAFVLGTSAGRGPPIAEAGFTMTPLEPTYSLSPSDNRTRHQNQNFVLLGGHTQQAFINMSQVALFSLPEESWSFLPVDSPPTPPKVDLATRTPPTVEPRSGHTAVLSPDGERLVVFGGWVGDVHTPAHPQMAVLHLGDGYGGDGHWRWSIPTSTGLGLEDGIGLFGHGAVMLPGSVMLIMGGYVIPKGGKLRPRGNNPRPNKVNYLFNTTSSSWISSYAPPIMDSSSSNSSDPPPRSVAKGNKAGLAAGLTFGLLAFIILILLYWWYSRRLKRRNAQNLIADDHRGNRGAAEKNMPRSEMSDIHWTNDQNEASRGGYPWARQPSGATGERVGLRESDAEAERTGLLFEIPSPTRGLRRSLHTRGSYQPAPRFDEGRRAHGPSTIHPIDERDEYDEVRVNADPFEKSDMGDSRRIDVFQSAPVLDYHRDPGEPWRPSSSHSSTRARELEVRNWVSDWAAADAFMHQQAGRTSPDKTDRTSSTLSEQSTRSTQSAHSYQPSVGRSISQRSAGFFSSKALASANEVTTTVSPPENHSGPHSPSRIKPDHRRSRSLTLFSGSPRMMTSDPTAHPSFPQLQAESEALLGNYRDPRRTSPTRSQRLTRGWMGSVRRAFTGASASPEHGASASSLPTKYTHTEEGIPRRAASAGAMLWQKRQGAKDWDADHQHRMPTNRDVAVGNANNAPRQQQAEDEEWDVESAVERRVVQVMFTVPREKLRVVNGGPDGDGDDGVSVLSAEVQEGSGEESGKGKEREVDVG